MIKKALIVLADGFEEIEAIAPIDILRRAGVEVVIAGLAGVNVKSARGVNLSVDAKLDEVGTDFDCLVLPGGGGGARNLAASASVKVRITEMHKSGKVIAAICASPVIVLAPTGVLEGKAATCYPGMEDGFAKNVTCRQEGVVIDGNIITSRGAGTSIEFSLAVVERLCGKQAAEEIAGAIVFHE